MNGIQIQHILNMVEKKSAQNRLVVRGEVLDYLRKNMDDVAKKLAIDGEFIIPTRYGGIRIATEDLETTAA